MWQRSFEKSKYSEWVIRNSLYWLTQKTAWKLEDEGASWIIFLENGAPDCEFELERLINDYQLREKLQQQTGVLRDSIIRKVLESIDERLTP
ncbi:His-Xaa-Ser system protein HxsD [Serratia rubidaea]|uniref:His-Xaa-Ser system protein HxsD n=1 Tax=Serratia rubidaea TaxID=61652 RepID=UPI0023B051AB|nr:His-Xaa-Ser system protein HxsD [Serratia rubidaea]MDK1703109.1 His-Xaa-Ser system protein HxsD [Serratia rubidaea]